MGWATRWEPQGVCTTALARIAAATAMAGNTRQTRSGLRLWRGERWRPKNRIGGTVTSCKGEGRMTMDEGSFCVARPFSFDELYHSDMHI